MTTGFSLRQLLEQAAVDFDDRQVRINQVSESMLRESAYLRHPNFEEIGDVDLARCFQLYDTLFFDGLLAAEQSRTPLTFRISSRMTKAGGKTTRFRDRRTSEIRYEIAVSSTLLFESFEEGQRTIEVTGYQCENRLEALLRIFEHELVHLAELMAWESSSCSRKRFRSIASRFFGHTAFHHQLVTPRETALIKHGIQVGEHARFVLDGVTHVGLVNRITRRATVLVESRRGQRYSNGKKYLKYYVPLELLEPVE